MQVPPPDASVCGSQPRNATPGEASPPQGETERSPDEWHVNPWEWLSLTILHGLTAALMFALGLKGLYLVGRGIGTVEWLLRRKRRRRFAATVSAEIARKLTPLERRHVTREYFMRTRCDKLFYLIFDSIPEAERQRLVSIPNRSLLDEVYSRERGVYVAMAHHGSLQVLGLFLPLMGYRVAAVRDPHEGPLRRFVQRRLHRRFPEMRRTRFIFNDAFPREIYRALQGGYVLGSALDVARLRNPQQRTEDVTMFGEWRPVLSGPLRIALRCGSPVLQLFCVPERDFHYRMDLTALVPAPEMVEDEAAAISGALRSYAAGVEQYLNASPGMLTRL